MNICYFIKLEHGLGDFKKEFQLKYFQTVSQTWQLTWPIIHASSSEHAVKIHFKITITLKVSF